MITDSYDTSSKPIITLESFYGESRYICDICIVTFSKTIHDYVLSHYDCSISAYLGSANGNVPVYIFEHNGKKYAFYLSAIGAPVAGNFILEANHMVGATKFLFFGSSGSLDREKTYKKYILPTEAYRDEGMSYHYAPPADYITIRGCVRLAEIFDLISVPYVKGRVWTTDAMLRETEKLTADRKKEGCIAVEMELAGLQAICDFHNLELYEFIFSGDVLDGDEYDASELSSATHDINHLFVALKVAEQL